MSLTITLREIADDLGRSAEHTAVKVRQWQAASGFPRHLPFSPNTFSRAAVEDWFAEAGRQTPRAEEPAAPPRDRGVARADAALDKARAGLRLAYDGDAR